MRSGSTAVLALLACALAGCPDAPSATHQPIRNPAAQSGFRLLALDPSDPIRSAADGSRISLRAARNEWISFTLQVTGAAELKSATLRISALRSANGCEIGAAARQVYQILPMPIEINPGYVRHTGAMATSHTAPRALLPLASYDGAVDLSALRDPTQPTNPAAHSNGSGLLWVDVRVPAAASPGEYEAQCALIDKAGRLLGPPLPVELTVYDFALPDRRNLQMVGKLPWPRLAALYPGQFGDTITPSLINRRDPRYAGTLRTMDQLMALAEQNRAALTIPGLRPTVKWPGGEPPQIDWREFDGLIGPWLRGETFTDRVPLSYWPLPAAQGLARYDTRSRMEYWSLAAMHFDQMGWLANSTVCLGMPRSAASTADNGQQIASEASQVLSLQPRVRVTVPLEDEQIDGLLKPGEAERVVTAAPALVSASPGPAIGAQATHRRHWLRTDLAGLVPYAGTGGDEQDVRVWAWLAFLRHAQLVSWENTLPTVNSAAQASDPSELVWFYPGEWFGLHEPLPTIQLKWLRRAAQDYEYLDLARDRGEVINALQMARLITKPVEILPGQDAEPAYALMTGTTNHLAWEQAQELLARTILLHQPGHPLDEARQRALYIETLQWAQPQERPLLMARSATWRMEASPTSASGGNWMDLQLSLDIYNASDVTPDKNQLKWAPPAADSGWEVHPQPIDLPRLQTYHVLPATMSARFDLGRLTPTSRQPLEVSFINGYTNVPSELRVVAPVAACDRREGPLALDGKLNDWNESDAIQDGPLVLMMSRPDLQRQQLQYAPVKSRIFSAWGRENFYLAFALEGMSADPHQAHNDVYYQARRAWGEDLCEVLVQPVFADHSLGPVLHLVCKPNGADWVERKAPAGKPRRDWQAMEGSGVRYATTTSADGRWRGELGIPWNLICGPDRPMPVLLRFNFTQHRNRPCESASWCGPIDFGRDDQLMGVLYLRTPKDLEIPTGTAEGE